VRLERLGKFKKFTSSGLEPATFRLVAIVPQPTTLPRALNFIKCGTESVGRTKMEEQISVEMGRAS
jgi:hypothetical protein